MCLILLALDQHPRYSLVLATNRDEFFARPTTPAAFWPEAPDLLAGRDLQAGGTWLGITRQGRLAAVTNVREPGGLRAGARSRGDLTGAFLLSQQPAAGYLDELQGRGGDYNGYNLICGDVNGELYYQSNRQRGLQPLAAGFHGISNASLDTPWPKVVQGQAALHAVLIQEDFLLDDLLPVLNNRNPAPDEQLPDTGAGQTMERMLSSRFIHSAGYGTRASTILRVDREGRVEWKEWRWNGDGELEGATRYGFNLQ